MAQITIPDELIVKNPGESNPILDQLVAEVDQWARTKIEPLVTKDTPSNLYQDLKTRAIEDSGFKVVDDKGKDLLKTEAI